MALSLRPAMRRAGAWPGGRGCVPGALFAHLSGLTQPSPGWAVWGVLRMRVAMALGDTQGLGL